MNMQQLRTRVLGAFVAGLVGFGATSAFANVEAFDSVEDAFAAENEDFAAAQEGAATEAVTTDAFGHHPFPPPFPPHGRGRYVCVAQNLRGQAFYGRDRMEFRARQEALDNCYRARSARCFVTDCDYVRH